MNCSSLYEQFIYGVVSWYMNLPYPLQVAMHLRYNNMNKPL